MHWCNYLFEKIRGFVLLLIIAVVCVKKYLDNKIIDLSKHIKLEELDPPINP